MQSLKLPIWILAGLFWFAVLPLGFVTLYSAIELQNAARATPDVNPRLAMLNTIALVRKLDAAEARYGQAQDLQVAFRMAKNTRYEARDKVRSAAVDILSANGTPEASAKCTAPEEALLKCLSQNEGAGAACLVDWRIIQACHDEALAFEKSALDADRSRFLDLRERMNKARDQTSAHNLLAEKLRAVEILEQDKLFPVADALRQPYTKKPLQLVFALPQGVVVACFTSLMAMLGTGVAALIKFRRSKASTRRADALKSSLVAPLIGGLTGFMVYFVVSAGTAVLVQPSPSDSAQPISNLSAPALASLGIFAGLAAEQAIAWLQEKASAFFRTDERAQAEPAREPRPDDAVVVG